MLIDGGGYYRLRFIIGAYLLHLLAIASELMNVRMYRSEACIRYNSRLISSTCNACYCLHVLEDGC
jgi:hypothetical protein